MSAPQPLHSFLGGISLAVPVHSLLVLNGSVFGISGFLHRSFKGDREALLSTILFLASGALAGILDHEPVPALPSSKLTVLALSGFLVGAGTKLGNGCTSGHMLAGVGRLSPRSLAATATFMATGAVTANILHSGLPPLQAPLDWSLSSTATKLLLAQSIPFLASLWLYYTRPANPDQDKPTEKRKLALVSTVATFGLALHLSGMTSAFRVLRFLLLPIPSHLSQFDPSLVFLAAGAMPVVIGLYQAGVGIIRKKEGENESPVPALGGKWNIPCNRCIDTRLLTGAALFGIGWGMAGICPGPGLVNFGHALIKGSVEGLISYGTWIGAAVLGGFFL